MKYLTSQWHEARMVGVRMIRMIECLRVHNYKNHVMYFTIMPLSILLRKRTKTV
jgi:hypothetical protein